MVDVLLTIKLLGFHPKNGTDGVYSKSYNGYEIKINYNADSPEKSEIDYGKKILCNRKTTCNFHQEETFVVLECVNRLLEKGYKPENIELEKSWGMGHTEGYLDILVKDEENKSFAMIECKTWGKEYDKYVKETFTHKNKSKENDGGQVFTYLQQEPKTTKAICYYASHVVGKSIEYKNAIIHNKEDWAELNQVERFNRWSKTFETNGIFEDDIPLYRVESKAIRRKDLKELKEEDSRKLYVQFAEILRHNVISDKPNAFNKIINLFLCKVYDEEKAPNDEMKFQIRKGNHYKTDEELLEDLNDLYKAGMKEYFQYEISDYTRNDFDLLMKYLGDTDKKPEFEDLYKTLRLYKNNEFAFKEVFDKKSFIDNAKVVREVVEMLQNYQLRYTKKQQFLGDFYETLLNDSIKQEAGQYFTPVPLTQFIIKSIPLEDIIKEKINTSELNILPYVIDYACGTGHFLTEIMEEINDIIKNKLDENSIEMNSIKKRIQSWKIDEFSWADEYIYGMDLDYRLIKASKISCFLNGDGKANLLHANGLAPFNSEEYTGKLHSDEVKQDNPTFDILIANPPYAVDEFGKHALKNGEQCFKLYSDLTEKSSSIECFFVERAKQLLKEGGIAGIVLPVSLLTNDKIYIKTREIILKYFDIKGILALQDNAFMATNTKTIILFMQRRNNTYWEQINLAVQAFCDNYHDVTVAGIEKAFSIFVEANYENLSFEDYVSILRNNPSEMAKQSEFYIEHKGLSNDALKTLEQDKMLYFFLAYNSKLVLANSGEKAEEKQFLGYEFKTVDHQRKINIKRDDNKNIQSCLFSDTSHIDDEKLNSYIYKNFIEKDIEQQILDINLQEQHPLNGHIEYCRLSELIDFSLPKFDKKINLNSGKKLKINSCYPQERVKNLVSYFNSGVTYDNDDVSNEKTENVVLTADNINLLNKLDIKKRIYLKGEVKLHPDKKLQNKDIFICLSSGSKRHVGKVAYIDRNMPYYAGGFMGIIRVKEKLIRPLYFYTILQHPYIKQTLEASSTGNNINNLYSALNDVKLPIPPLSIQDKIVEEINFLVSEQETAQASLNRLKYDIIKLVDSKNVEVCKLKRVVNTNPEKLSCNDNTCISFIDMSSVSTNGYIIHQERKSYSAVKHGSYKSFQENDVIIAKIAPCMENGKCAIARNLINQIGFGSTEFHVFRCNTDYILPEILFYKLNRQEVRDEAHKVMTGKSGHRRVPIEFYEEMELSLPNIEEQKNLVKIISQKEAEIERLQKEIDEIPAKKQAILDKYLK